MSKTHVEPACFTLDSVPGVRRFDERDQALLVQGMAALLLEQRAEDGRLLTP